MALFFISLLFIPSVLSLIFSKKPALWMCNEPPSVELRYKTRTGFKKIITSFLLIIDKFIVHRKVNKIVVVVVLAAISAADGMRGTLIVTMLVAGADNTPWPLATYTR